MKRFKQKIISRAIVQIRNFFFSVEGTDAEIRKEISRLAGITAKAPKLNAELAMSANPDDESENFLTVYENCRLAPYMNWTMKSLKTIWLLHRAHALDNFAKKR